MTAHKPKPAPTNPLLANRRANPLISRRKSPIKSADNEEVSDTTETAGVVAEKQAEVDAEDVPEQPEDEASEKPEVSSESPKGLNGLLAGRRRLVGRKPGTI